MARERLTNQGFFDIEGGRLVIQDSGLEIESSDQAEQKLDQKAQRRQELDEGMRKAEQTFRRVNFTPAAFTHADFTSPD